MDRTPEDVPTRDLVRAAREEGGASFAALYERLAPALQGWAVLRVRGPLAVCVDPEDVVQEVCCRAYRDFENFDAELGSFRAWIFGIATRVLQAALMELSRSRRASRPAAVDSATGWLDQVPDDATRATREVARDESLRRFFAEVAGYGDDERRLVLYRGLEGLSHEATAELMGLSHDVVKKRWQRLRARLAAEGAPAQWLMD